MQLTDEQAAIVDAARSTRDNLLVTARAGSGKTATIVAVAQALPSTTVGLCLAFNKSIKEEMQRRMPDNFKAQTLNGCGFAAWQRYIRKRCKVDGRKNYFLLRGEIEKLEKLDADEAWDSFSETLKAIGSAKNCGYIPREGLPPAFRPLTSRDDFYNLHLEFDASPLQRQLIDRVCSASFTLAREGTVDFDDMLLGPAVSGVDFDVYDEVLVDEAQDLSMINHVLLRKLKKPPTRIIAVGDPCQAIYGFRGADSSSMDSLRDMFKMRDLYLTMTFRNGENIVRNVHWRAPDMRWRPDAPPGEVLRPEFWSSADLPDGAAIICRNNAPLFSIAITLLREGRYPEIAGRDIVKGLLTKMKKLGKPKLDQESALASLRGWHESEKKRMRDHKLLADQVECMEIFIRETETLGDAMAFAESLMNRDGRIYLMTGHKAKGLEFPVVFFLDPHLLRIKEGQDNNIKYVIETRAEERLVYVSSESFKRKDD